MYSFSMFNNWAEYNLTLFPFVTASKMRGVQHNGHKRCLYM